VGVAGQEWLAKALRSHGSRGMEDAADMGADHAIRMTGRRAGWRDSPWRSN